MSGKLLKEKIVKSILFLCAAFSIIAVLSIIGYLAYMGDPAVIGFFLHGTAIFNDTPIGPGNAVLSINGYNCISRRWGNGASGDYWASMRDLHGRIC